MRVAFVLDETVKIGGGFQQSLSTIVALRGLERHEILVLTSRPENVEIVRSYGIACELYRFGRARRLLTRVAARNRRLRRLAQLLPARLRGWPFDAVLDAHGVDLVICFFLSWVPDYLFHRPFITVVYDLCHREHCEFPEVSERFEFESRERIFREVLPRAVAILLSSDSLVRQLAQYYGIDAARTVTVPFLPAAHARVRVPQDEITRVREKYSLPQTYVFYPAQFWPHKNHLYVLEAIRILADSGQAPVAAAFCGSDFGNAAHVRRAAERLGVTRWVHFLGFVDSGDMAAIYSAASALVMPTYFGPTNLPPLEAMAVGCPVIYSDLAEFRADLGDAALYCDLDDPATLADRIRSLLTQPQVSERLREAGARLVTRATDDSYVRALQPVLDRFDYLRQRWATR